MRPASVAADTGVRSSDRSRLRTGSSATLADAGSSMTHRSTMTRKVTLTNIFVKAFSPEFRVISIATRHRNAMRSIVGVPASAGVFGAWPNFFLAFTVEGHTFGAVPSHLEPG